MRVEANMPPLDRGQVLDIVIEGSDGEAVWTAEVILAQGKSLAVSHPQRGPEQLPEPDGPVGVTCRIFQQGTIWTFPSQITDVRDASFILAMPRPKDVSKEQRREHVRATVSLKGKLAFRLAGHHFADDEAEIVDLSGGGCQIVTGKALIPNVTMRLEIPLPGQPIVVHGRIVRASPFPRVKRPPRYFSGLQFTEIAEADRETLIRFIFQTMRESLKQGNRLI